MPAIRVIHNLVRSSFGEGKPVSAEIEFTPKPREQGSCNYRIWFGAYLIDICAWDNAYCLDILVFLNDPSTEEPVWSAAGACETEEGFRARFAQFIQWLEEQRA